MLHLLSSFCCGVPVARFDFFCDFFTSVACRSFHCVGVAFEASGELAPPSRLRREGPEDWTGVLTASCARKQKSICFLPRSLLEKMKRATVDDDEFRVRVECRRSSRLSHSLPPSFPDLGVALEDGLPPIAEVMESIEVIRPSVAVSDGAQVGQSLVVLDGLQSVGREGGMDLGSSLVAESTSDFEGSQAKDDGDRQMVEGGEGGQGDADLPMASMSLFCSSRPVLRVLSGCGPMVVGEGIVDDAALFFGNAMTVGDEAVLVDGGLADMDDATGGSCALAGDASVSTVASADALGCDSESVHHSSGDTGPLVGGQGVQQTMTSPSGGGMVREEGRAPPVAKEAVRPQPTDGLRQLPRSSEESLPVSEAEAAAEATELHPSRSVFSVPIIIVNLITGAPSSCSASPPTRLSLSLAVEAASSDQPSKQQAQQVSLSPATPQAYRALQLGDLTVLLTDDGYSLTGQSQGHSKDGQEHTSTSSLDSHPIVLLANSHPKLLYYLRFLVDQLQIYVEEGQRYQTKLIILTAGIGGCKQSADISKN
ncbi:hypothetical protein Dimus_012957 [Dionaea muscipula]